MPPHHGHLEPRPAEGRRARQEGVVGGAERGLQPENGTLDAAQKTPRVSVALAFERECGLQPETRAPVQQHRLACGNTGFACRLLQNASFKHSILLLLVNLGD